jgi:dTMP kinase
MAGLLSPTPRPGYAGPAYRAIFAVRGTKRGLFITFEGVDGAGKSTQLRLLLKHLRAHGYQVRATREPGGTKLGEQIRRILLASQPNQDHAAGRSGRKKALSPLAELALVYAARAQHVAEVVAPALARGEIVVSDRFNDASLAYQGFGRSLGVDPVRAFDGVVCQSMRPDLTILLDIAPSIALARARQRENRRRSRRSRFEQEGLEFQRRVRAGYLKLARQEPGRVKVVSANRAAEQIQSDVRTLVEPLLMAWAGRQKAGSRSVHRV